MKKIKNLVVNNINYTVGEIYVDNLGGIYSLETIIDWKGTVYASKGIEFRFKNVNNGCDHCGWIFPNGKIRIDFKPIVNENVISKNINDLPNKIIRKNDKKDPLELGIKFISKLNLWFVYYSQSSNGYAEFEAIDKDMNNALGKLYLMIK